jgi:GT2 family glycosyltransferase
LGETGEKVQFFACSEDLIGNHAALKINRESQDDSFLQHPGLQQGALMEFSIRPSRKKVDWQQVDVQASQLKILGEDAVLKIDRIVHLDGSVVVTGWCSKSMSLRVPNGRLNEKYGRSDMGSVVGHDVTGFVLVGGLADTDPVVEFYITFDDKNLVAEVPVSTSLSMAEKLLAENIPHIHLLFPLLVRQSKWRQLFSGITSNQCDPAIKCEIEGVAAVKGAGLVAMGWVSGPREMQYWLISGREWRSLEDTIRLDRNDIVHTSGDEPGMSASKPGFYACFRGDYARGDSVTLLAVGPGTLCIAATSSASIVHEDPVQLSRLLFAVPSPLSTFTRRLEQNEGPVLQCLIERRAESWSDDCVVDLRFGHTSEDCDISIIVPLYKRWDLIEHQLAAFSQDSDFGTRIELIYVIDDPDLVDVLERNAPLLHELYRVPFRVIWGGLNRGYAGANNFGAANATGTTLILLNSDVFPGAPGWAAGLSDLLAANEDYGVIAPRLVYPDGTIQHAGMAFEYEPAFSIWVNRHPMAGLPVSADRSVGLVERTAVTGACMAMRSEDYWAVDGFDTGYLIGDFEDSDLCLKIKATGKRIGYTNALTLTHLERQSFGSIGEGDYRQKVVLFNAWRHFNRWKETILASAERSFGHAAAEVA